MQTWQCGAGDAPVVAGILPELAARVGVKRYRDSGRVAHTTLA
ncbi:MAG TPA: hypothetical protein VEO19_15850 [Terriglobia bacterium]|nr:hypothetical protein [Terriglobia bacterium]